MHEFISHYKRNERRKGPSFKQTKGQLLPSFLSFTRSHLLFVSPAILYYLIANQILAYSFSKGTIAEDYAGDTLKKRRAET